MASKVNYDLKIMQVMEKHRLSYILKSTNANSITMVIWDNAKAQGLIAELKETFYQITVKQVALVCCMGTNIAHPGFLYKAAKALCENNINIECFAQSLRQVNMQFVITRDGYAKAIVALNNALCI
jgi:aspartate kinase